jgi:putative NADPH-quinone reductase
MKVVVIQGHPDAGERHFCHALAEAYRTGAEGAGHEVRVIDVGSMEFPILRSPADYADGTPPAAIAAAQETVAWGDHLVFVYPLWLGTMPALLKAFLEQLLRPSFIGWKSSADSAWKRPRSRRRTARLIVTMGMPPLLYRLFYRAHGVRAMERSILGFIGVKGIRRTLIGMAGSSEAGRERWVRKVEEMGRKE